MADNNDDLFGGPPQQNTEHNHDVEVEDIDGNEEAHEEEANEEEQQKLKETRKRKKDAFVKRYLMEKVWWKEEQRKAEEQRRREQEMMKKRMQQFTNADQLSILEKYEVQDKEDEFFKPITKFKGPTSDRVLTNKYYIYLWIVLNGFFVIASLYVLTDGRPARLNNGYDFRTELCGNGKYSSKPYLYYLNPVQDIRVAMCVTTCPSSSGPLICLYDTTGGYYSSQYTKFCYTQMQSQLVSKYCVPNEPINGAVVNAYLGSFDLTVKRFASDLNLSADVMGCGAILTVILAFVFLYFLKKQSTVSCFVSLVFLLKLMCCGGLAFMFYREYTLELEKNCFTQRDENNCVGSRGYNFRIFALLVIIYSGLYVLLLMLLSKRILKIVGFLKLASQVVDILQQIKWIPFYVLLVAIVVSTLSLICVPFGLSVADVQTIDSNSGAISGGKLKIMSFSGFAYFIGFYDFFIFVIWMFFLLGFRDLFVGYCITLWFFTKRKDTVQIPKWVIFKNILKYHVGTIVMYSLISTIITLPKVMIMVVRKSLRSLPQYMNSVRYFQATCNCCLFSYEKFLRYFSKNSLIQVAITSMEFYPSSKISYFLVFRNKDKISDMDGMQQFVVFNIKFLVSFISGLAVYVVLSFLDKTPLNQQNTSEIQNKYFPGIILAMFSYFFSAIFLGSYDITCKSVIQCYLIDQEIFFGENRYVEPFIKNVFEYYVKEDLEKYKLQSKKGVVLDEEKAKKKDEVSDDDKQYQSEEEDSQASAEDLKAKQKKPTVVINDSTVTQATKFQTQTVTKPFLDSPGLQTKPNGNTLATQSNNNTPQRLITADKTASNITPQRPQNGNTAKPPVREQELVNLDSSQDSDDYDIKKAQNLINNNSSYNFNNQRINTAQSNGNTPILAASKPPLVTIPLQNIQPNTTANLLNNPSRQNLDLSNNNVASNQRLQSGGAYQSTMFQFRDNTAPVPSPSQHKIPSRSNINMMGQANTQPVYQNNPQNNLLNQRQYQPQTQMVQQNMRMNNPIFTNSQINNNYDNDEGDDHDDFGLGSNVYANPNTNQHNASQFRQPARNEMRLLNASYASSGIRGATGQSNASKVSKVSKASFDPFMQFEKNQIEVDSDESDED